MLLNVFNQGISLQIGGQSMRFRSPRELEFALSGKASPSSGRAAEIVGLPVADLARTSDALKRIEGSVDAALTGGTHESSLVRFFSASDSWMVEDNGWKDILGALRRAPADSSPYQRVALRQYRRYLQSCQELIRAVFEERRDHHQRQGNSAKAAAQAVATRVRQSLIFDVSELAGKSGRERHEFTRLPKGEGMTLAFEPHQALSLILGKHKFVLVSGAPWLLIDPTGNDAQIRPTKCVVGRDPLAHITVDDAYRSVSRRHLVIEADDERLVRLTDTSSLGSYVAQSER